MVVQFHICSLGRAEMHACGDGFERERCFSPQTCGDVQLGRIILSAAGQILLPPATLLQFLGNDALGLGIGSLAMQLPGMVSTQAALHAPKHLAFEVRTA